MLVSISCMAAGTVLVGDRPGWISECWHRGVVSRCRSGFVLDPPFWAVEPECEMLVCPDLPMYLYQGPCNLH